MSHLPLHLFRENLFHFRKGQHQKQDEKKDGPNKCIQSIIDTQVKRAKNVLFKPLRGVSNLYCQNAQG